MKTIFLPAMTVAIAANQLVRAATLHLPTGQPTIPAGTDAVVNDDTVSNLLETQPPSDPGNDGAPDY
jgi:hypothetical protein